MNISQTTFIYDTQADACFVQEPNWPLQELTIKGSTDYQGIVNGTWFQADHLTNHWISFRKDRFQANKWEVFYKCVSKWNKVLSSFILPSKGRFNLCFLRKGWMG